MAKNKVCIKNENDKKYLIRRLNIICGQIKGVNKMIEDSRCYEDIIIELKALNNSLKGVNKKVLESYMTNCLGESSKKEVEEIIKLYDKLD